MFRVVALVGEGFGVALYRTRSGALAAYIIADRGSELVAVCGGDREDIESAISSSAVSNRVVGGMVDELADFGLCVAMPVGSSIPDDVAVRFLANAARWVPCPDIVLSMQLTVPPPTERVIAADIRGSEVRVLDVPVNPLAETKALSISVDGSEEGGEWIGVGLLRELIELRSGEEVSRPTPRVVALLVDEEYGLAIHGTSTGARIAYLKSPYLELYLFKDASPEDVEHVLREASEITVFRSFERLARRREVVEELAKLSRQSWVGAVISSMRPLKTVYPKALKLVNPREWSSDIVVVDDILLPPPYSGISVMEFTSDGQYRELSVPLPPSIDISERVYRTSLPVSGGRDPTRIWVRWLTTALIGELGDEI